jgi:hypothetical protein
MPTIDFSSYQNQDVDTPYVVGSKNRAFIFTHLIPKPEKLLFRRWEIYPFGPDDWMSGLFLPKGDVLVELPTATKRQATFDFVAYSGGDHPLRVRGYNASGTYIGFCDLPHKAEASVRRASLELPGLKYIYFSEKREYLLVAVYVDDAPKRKLQDIREISDFPSILVASKGRLSLRKRNRRRSRSQRRRR